MLNAYIIEEQKRRERERLEKERQRPVVELPENEDDQPRKDERRGQAPSRVITIDVLNGG